MRNHLNPLGKLLFVLHLNSAHQQLQLQLLNFLKLPLSSFFNETEEKIGNEKKPWTTSSSQLEILYTEQFTSTFPAYFSKNLIELKGISPINPFITVVINPIIIKTRQKKKIISTKIRLSLS